MIEQGLFETLFVVLVGGLIAIIVLLALIGRISALFRKDVEAAKAKNIFEWKG